DDRGLDSWIERRTIESEQSAFAVADYANSQRRWRSSQLGSLLRLERIDCGEHFLHFITDDVPAHLKGLTINPLAMGLVGETFELGIARPGVLPIDQHRNYYLAAVLRQPPRPLRLRRKAGSQA